MATFSATNSAATAPVFENNLRGVKHTAYGSITLAANPAINDVLEFCWIPAGATIVGGRFRGQDLDTNGTPTLDIDIGWAANGVEAADTDGLGNFGVLNGSAVTNYLPEGGYNLPLNGTLNTGPKQFTNRTKITGIVNAAAATFAAGTIWVEVEYLVGE